METSATQAYSLFLLTSGYSSDTARTYVYAVRLWLDWAACHEVDDESASRGAIEHFISDQLARLSSTTARNRLFAVRAYFDFLISRGVRDDNPTAGLKVKKARSLPKQPVPIGDQRRLVFGAHSLRDQAMWSMLIDTGLRIGELASMKIENVRWTDGTVLITGKGNKQREVWASPETWKLVRDYIGSRFRGAVWLTKEGSPMSRDRARQNFYRQCQRLQIHAHPHQLRVTFANVFLQEGGRLDELQEAMGHSDISTTAHYAGASKRERAMNQMRQLSLASRLYA